MAMTLDQILTDCGVPDEAKLYLRARGITTPGVLCTIGVDVGEFDIKVVDAFIQGHDFRSTNMKFNGDAAEQDVLRATLLVAYDMCRMEKQRVLTAAITALALPASGAAASASAAASTTAPKVPSTLPTDRTDHEVQPDPGRGSEQVLS